MRNLGILINILLLAALLAMTSCRHDEMIIPSEETPAGNPEKREVKGFYLLNEGNMGSNKCTLDYYDFGTATYSRNIYSEKNPTAVMELGDVGNDIAIYGSKLYIVVNCSHKVEVLEAASGKRLGQVDIPNCRYIKFKDGNAYVSSYVGGVGIDPNSPQGAVFRIDTLSLQVTGKVTTGYQPEELEIIGNRLYVANSGGYRQPDYDDRVSVIDLESFSNAGEIKVAQNLSRLRKDQYGRLWVTSRGNHKDLTPGLHLLQTDGSGNFRVSHTFDIATTNIALRGDTLFYLNSPENGESPSFGLFDITTLTKLTDNFITDGTDREIVRPYGLATDPHNGDIYVTDAKNYVSSGTLYCFDNRGHKKWEARTGDIPTAIAFTSNGIGVSEGKEPGATPKNSRYISRVYEYCPAPGQFINETPVYEEGDTYEDILRKCTEAIGGTNGGLVSLGGYGGYITFGFDHTVRNIEGEKDFRLRGNCVWQSVQLRGGSAEPGIVMVSRDTNGNGLPDDEWYELRGSEHDNPATVSDYQITYFKSESAGDLIRWEDNRGASGLMARNTFHQQSYWPLWATGNTLTFRGTLLPPNGVDSDGTGSNFVLYSFGWGYADNYPNNFADENSFDIGNAIDRSGHAVSLEGIDFIRIYTGVNQQCGWVGETSTEISGAEDLHFFDE